MAQDACSRACAVIVAGGSGTRFGNPGGKLLIEVAGRPLLAWTLAAFDAAAQIGYIVVVCKPTQYDEIRRAVVEPFGFAAPITFAPSGAERQDSTRNGMDAVPAGFDIIAVHDGARPLIQPATIDGAIQALVAADADRLVTGAESDTRANEGVGAPYPAKCRTACASVSHVLDGVVCGQPAIDTLKVIDADGNFVETPPRAQFWTVQTPQVFWLDSLRRAYAWANETGFVGTDDSSLVEGMGGRVRGFDSPRDNLKVTLPEDLAPVEAALLSRLQ
ncbi:MAG: IspD/TarI family cytidylyltransferase [Coriobacteriaceae bacterium]|nr:IspD/TarI family cytidylyltransferase [Coriobacteriaceae bacterium]